MECAIWARGLCKKYGTNKILDNLDLTVKTGTIYALLGASGCGKTTLLNAILNSLKIDCGVIRVLGQKPGILFRDIGYMPQDIAMVGEFTVRGAINHFGWLFGMKDEAIDERFKFLEKLLDLPPSNHYVRDLSGGQQRRVSLAATLIHNPQILLLDEPTVGLDPVLRQSIWDYLVLLSRKERKTIVITTHYIEEASQANAIGLMRNGKLLSEGSPGDLMMKYGCSNVEDVFLLLSRKQQAGGVAGEAHLFDISSRNYIQVEDCEEHLDDIKDKIYSTWLAVQKCILFTNRHHAKALITKNFQKFAWNKGTLIFCYVFPLLVMNIFFTTVGKDPKTVKIGIYNPEMAPYNTCEEYAAAFKIGGSWSPTSGRCNYTGLACKYVLGIESDSFQHIYSHYFTAKTGRNREGLYVNARDLEELQINIYMDKSSYPISKYVERKLLNGYGNFTEQLERECGFNVKAAAVPLRKLDPVYGSYDAEFIEFVAPGTILIVSVFLAVSVSALSIVTERAEGTWNRTLVAGVSTSEIVIFHFLAMAVVNALQNLLLFFVTFGVFRFECKGDLGTVLLLLTLQGIMGTAFGTLISVLSRTVTDSMMLSLGLFYPVMLLSGVLWPLEGMYPAVRYFSYYLMPSTMSVQAMANIMNRGWNILNLHVAKGFLSSIGWTILFNILNVVFLKNGKN